MTTTSFRTLDLPASWLENLDDLGYTEMTPIQARALPALLARRDVMGRAATGTGKTVAFGLALLAKIEPGGEVPGALVLCPTRELAEQVASELRRLARPLHNTQVLSVCGGRPFHRQKISLEHGVDVVVGTPGRVLAHLRRETLDLSAVDTLVLDEADRMLDMGFLDDVAAIIDATPDARQTALVTATMTDEVRAVGERFQDDALLVSVADAEMSPDITQIVYDIGSLDRLHALERVLAHHRPDSALVFCNERATCNEVVVALRDAGHCAQTMHGGLAQRDRDGVLEMFGNGSLRILVATNVAARGIDLDAVEAVVNYELPHNPTSFVHRIGRTGRAGGRGLAITLVDADARRRLADYDDALAATTPTPVEDLSVSGRPPEPAAMRTLAIRGGRRDKLSAGDIVGALTGDIGLPGDAIGLITIRERIAFVAVERDLAARALEGVRREPIKGRSFGAFRLGS
jgi:ATP-independent RNA helicase DbpA